MDFAIKNEAQLREALASRIADDTIKGIELKYKLETWRSGTVNLVLISEHGWDLTSYGIEGDLCNMLQAIWQHNRWGDCIGRKTGKQIVHKLGWNLATMILADMQKTYKESRNTARRAINYHQSRIVEAFEEANEYFTNTYKGNLPDIPAGAHFKLEISIVDADGQLVKCSLDEE
jgi:hypothetical protein